MEIYKRHFPAFSVLDNKNMFLSNMFAPISRKIVSAWELVGVQEATCHEGCCRALPRHLAQLSVFSSSRYSANLIFRLEKFQLKTKIAEFYGKTIEIYMGKTHLTQ